MNNPFEIFFSQLREAIKNDVLEVIQKEFEKRGESEFINTDEARELLGGITKQTLRNLTKNGVINKYWDCENVVYKRGELIDYAKGVRKISKPKGEVEKKSGRITSPKRLTPTEAASYLDVSISTLYNLVRSGVVTPIKQSPKKVYYSQDSLDSYRNRQESNQLQTARKRKDRHSKA